MKKEIPFISIVTLNYNQTDVTCEFLASTRSLTYPRYEILVCDMDSREDPSKQIASGNYPATHVLLAKQNLGFAGGNNWGMRQAQGDFIFIVNNDTVVTGDLLEKLLQPFFDNPGIGVTCPKILYYNQPEIIQYAGFNPMNHYTGRASSVGNLQIDNGQYNTPGPTYGAHGCAMMVKREVIEKVGMFPEKFFLYYEEWDWSARILRAGYTIWYAADATIYHKESVTIGKSNPMKVYYHARNRILYIRRNATHIQLIFFTVFFTVFALPKAIITFLVKQQYKQLKYFIKGVFWNLHSSSHSAV